MPVETSNNFHFIVSSGPRLVETPATRTLIRKQAMKEVGQARKKRGDYGRVNMRQVPVFPDATAPIRSAVHPCNTPSSSEGSELFTPDTSDSGNDSDHLVLDEVKPKQLPPCRREALHAALHRQSPNPVTSVCLFSKYEAARSKFNLDVTDFAMLSNFHIGKGTIPILSADPMRLASIMGNERWSYLHFVPSRYESSECVAAATDCFLAKAEAVLLGRDKCKNAVLSLYAKALRSVQQAIMNDDRCMDADVLCATQLLSLHELLDPSRDTAWAHHVDGSAKLIEHRGTERFITEFEKALFAAHIGPIIMEAMSREEDCFLEQPQWIKLYRSVAEDSDHLTERSTLTVNIRSYLFYMPGLWHDIGRLVNGPELFDDYATAALESRCRKAQNDFIDWMEDYKAHCVRTSLATPTQQELALRRELFGMAVECLAVVKRLLATVCDHGNEKLESEAQALAHLILDLQNQPSTKHSWLFREHEVAYTILFTKDQWEGTFNHESKFDQRIAARARYKSWSSILMIAGGNPTSLATSGEGQQVKEEMDCERARGTGQDQVHTLNVNEYWPDDIASDSG